MKTKSYLFLLLGISIALVSFTAYVYFTHTPQFAAFYTWAQNNLVLFITIVFVFKVLGVVYPPLPSAIFTVGAIPILGWLPAYLIDLVGSVTAGSIDYFLGKKYGFTILKKLFDAEVVNKLKNLKIKPHREIESVIVLRTLLGGVILEAVYYGAGLLGIKFRNFILGAALSHAFLGLPTFLLGEALLQNKNIPLSLISACIAIFVAIKLKDRYFENLSV